MKPSKNIVFVDPRSVGVKYGVEAKRLGLRPIALMTRRKFPSEIANYYDTSSCDEVIYHTSLEETLSRLQDLQVEAIIPAGQTALGLVDRLTEGLGLVGNSASTHQTRIDKALMKKTLMENGVRCADYFLCKDATAALDWIRKRKYPVVIKPTQGVGSIQVRICLNDAEVIRAIGEIKRLDPLFSGDSDGVLVEEFLEGPEYFMNLASTGSKKRELICFARYEKIQVNGEPNICRNIFSLPLDDRLAQSTYAYVNDVNSALGVEYGINDVELKISNSGPAFIELNNRLPGATVPYLIQKCSGYNCYQENIRIFRGDKRENNKFTFKKHYCICCLINEKAGIVTQIEGLDEIKKLSSFDSIAKIAPIGKFLPQTTDFTTVASFINLVHEDPLTLKEEAEFVHRTVRISTSLSTGAPTTDGFV